MLKQAIKIATIAHKGQTDKGGHDYIGHPLRVMDSVKSENEKIVAVLHDVVEDTDITIEYLRGKGFSEEVFDGVYAMTRGKEESYNHYIKKVMSNDIAVVVKLADLTDNLNLTRLRSLKDIKINNLGMYLETYHKLKKLKD